MQAREMVLAHSHWGNGLAKAAKVAKAKGRAALSSARRDGNAKADELLTRNYRAPYIVPEKV